MSSLKTIHILKPDNQPAIKYIVHNNIDKIINGYR